MWIELFSHILTHDVAPGIEIMSCIKIDKPLVVYRFWVTLSNDVHNKVAYDKILTFLRKKWDFKEILMSYDK